ncbi:3-oxoacyl-ACP reductase FabG [Pseudochelatococcus lubricantis]|uniref:3-oxoacyl-ACP reductase FabG n=1 Tax=Pseudochelatococcus lubricantis TaxID=1538102 RepID=UPI0035ECF75F
MDMGLSGRVAVVTGGANGIGAAICRQLHQEGARVVVADLDGDKAAAVANELGEGASSFAVDVTREEQVQALIDHTVKTHGALNILVNNAGFTRDMRITKMALGDWDAVIDVILKGAFLCTRAALPLMIDGASGRIINISSRAHLGNPGQANYSSAKAGIIGFTRAMALEAGRHHITVNAVAPGIIDTDAVRRLPHYDKVRTAAEKTTPIPRIGEPEDVAAVVTFLASAHASYVTGDVLHVTGGRY